MAEQSRVENESRAWLSTATQPLQPVGVSFRTEAVLAAACGVLLLAGYGAHALGVPDTIHDGLHLAALAVGSVVPILGTVPQLRAGRIDVDFLMLFAAFGAAYLNQPGEGAILMFLFSGSAALESYTSGRTRRSIEALREHLETEAVRLDADGQTEQVPVEALRLGDRVLIRPGARVPADGVVLSGESSVDQAALTGESLPVVKGPGDTVLTGSINLTDGALTVRVEKEAADSTLARMLRMVEEAERNRARAQVFTDWFGERYTKLVIVGAAAAWLVPVAFFRVAWGPAFYKAMTLLVVASPCALVLATPAAILAAIATAARHGILVKGGASFESVAAARVVVFDKTGTLTLGTPRLECVQSVNGNTEAEVLRIAASAEQPSEHPLAAAIVTAAREAGLSLVQPDSFRSVTGKGVIATIAGEQVLVGSPRLFEAEGLVAPECRDEGCPDRGADGCRALRVSGAGVEGLLDLADGVRPQARSAVAALRRGGIRHVAMLTGDLRSVAERIGDSVGIDHVHAELLPDEKLERLRELRERYGPVIMVGDGVNDAPALAAADVGVAMGGIGSDVALETADVVLTSDDLSRLPILLDLSHRANRIVRQNLIFAISVIVVLVSLTLATDQVRLPLAVLGHEGSTVLVILNGLRLLRA